MENTQEKNTVAKENYWAQKVDLKLDRVQVEQLVWMALLGIRTSKWCNNLISCYNKDNVYWEEIAQTEFNMQDVKKVIEKDIAKLMTTPLECLLEPSGIDKKVLEIIDKLVSSKCKSIEDSLEKQVSNPC